MRSFLLDTEWHAALREQRNLASWGSLELAKDEEQAGGSADITCCQPSPSLLAVVLGTWCLEELTGVALCYHSTSVKQC